MVTLQYASKRRDSYTAGRPVLLQRKCACGGKCDDCSKKKAALQRRPADQAEDFSSAPQIVHEVLRSSGRPLDSSTRDLMESRFGHDFSSVRVHTDGRAAESARSVNAQAYTVGKDVVFDSGRYSPGTEEGLRLIAHELMHVTQQQDSNAAVNQSIEIGPSDDPFEHQAERSSFLTIGTPVHTGPGQSIGLRLQRQPADTEGAVETGPDKTKGKSDCSFIESHLTSFAISIAHHHYRTEVGGEAPMTGITCATPDFCKATFEDGVVVTVMMVEVPGKVSAGATIGGKDGKLCDYSYECPKGKPIVYKKIKCE